MKNLSKHNILCEVEQDILLVHSEQTSQDVCSSHQGIESCSQQAREYIY